MKVHVLGKLRELDQSFLFHLSITSAILVLWNWQMVTEFLYSRLYERKNPSDLIRINYIPLEATRKLLATCFYSKQKTWNPLLQPQHSFNFWGQRGAWRMMPDPSLLMILDPEPCYVALAEVTKHHYCAPRTAMNNERSALQRENQAWSCALYC